MLSPVQEKKQEQNFKWNMQKLLPQLDSRTIFLKSRMSILKAEHKFFGGFQPQMFSMFSYTKTYFLVRSQSWFIGYHINSMSLFLLTLGKARTVEYCSLKWECCKKHAQFTSI